MFETAIYVSEILQAGCGTPVGPIEVLSRDVSKRLRPVERRVAQVSPAM